MSIVKRCSIAYAQSPFDVFFFDRLGGVTSSYPIISAKLKAAFESAGIAGYFVKKLDHVVASACSKT